MAQISPSCRGEEEEGGIFAGIVDGRMSGRSFFTAWTIKSFLSLSLSLPSTRETRNAGGDSVLPGELY